jgi:hypothetical protein
MYAVIELLTMLLDSGLIPISSICKTAVLVICLLIGTNQGIKPTCYSQNVNVGGTLIFQPSICFIHIVAIIMTAIMIYHIQSKYTAVG